MRGRRGGGVLDDASDTGVPWRFMVSGSGSDIVNAVPPREGWLFVPPRGGGLAEGWPGSEDSAGAGSPLLTDY